MGDIIINPNRDDSNDPNIEFVGNSGVSGSGIYLNVLDDGTLSFEGTAGQLFSITDSLTGTIFSVNDISGIPSIEVDDDGTIRFAEFTGNVLIGTNTDDGSNRLQVSGNAAIAGNLNVDGNTLTVDSTLNRVGVQNSSPAYNLDVNGTARINGGRVIFQDGGEYGLDIDNRYYRYKIGDIDGGETNTYIDIQSVDNIIGVYGQLECDGSIKGVYNEKVKSLSGSTTYYILEEYWTEGNIYVLTTSGNTTINFDYYDLNSFSFIIKITAGGSHTITWPSYVKWPGGNVPSAPASGETNIYVFYYEEGDGGPVYGFLAGESMS